MKDARHYAMTATVAAFLLAMIASAGVAEETPAGHGIFSSSELKWGPGPPSLQAGAKSVVLEGDPAKEGLFTLRLMLPDGFQIKPHWHPAVEHITVISGTFNLGMGDTLDTSKGKAMSVGSFAFMAPKTNHFAWTKGETVIQLHGQGPWQINYLNPADDPRKK